MPEELSPQPRREPSPAARAVAGFFVALVITGAGLAWALVTVSKAAFSQVAADGGAAAAAISVMLAVAVYFAQTASTARRRAAALERELRKQEREFADLAQETLPLIARRARDGVTADDVFVSIPRPESGPVRALLTTLQLALSSLLDDASAAQRTAAAATADRADIEAQAAQLVEETIPAAVGRLRSGEPRDTALADIARPASPALDSLLDAVVTQVAAAERRSSSAMSSCASAAARIQAQSTRMLAELREMEVRYGDDKVFADLMELDHRVSQTGRLADSIALLAGGRSGRRWTKPIPMESILRGAMGRIDAYQRVRLHSISTATLAGYAAEGVMHALAELMDNAAAFSAHGSEVHVFVEEEDAGVVVTIDDSGLGMRRRERDRAGELVSQPLDLATLPGTRLGLAVVGRIADRYGLTVSFRPSSRGGTGVVVILPRRLISQAKGEISTPSRPRAETVGARPSPEPQPQPRRKPLASRTDGDADFGDLPVRPRGRTLAQAMPSAPGPSAAGTQAQEDTMTPDTAGRRPAADAGARFAAFRRSAGHGQGHGAPPGPGNPDAGTHDDGPKGTA
jgi:signal transduction histidine kinase